MLSAAKHLALKFRTKPFAALSVTVVSIFHPRIEKMSQSLLYLAYFFPPRGGAAVQRSLKFARYLPQFGWRPLVVANGGATVQQDNATKVQDPTLLEELSDDAVVRYTTLAPDEKRDYDRAQSKLRQRLNVTDPMGWWTKPAVRLGMEL